MDGYSLGIMQIPLSLTITHRADSRHLIRYRKGWREMTQRENALMCQTLYLRNLVFCLPLEEKNAHMQSFAPAGRGPVRIPPSCLYLRKI